MVDLRQMGPAEAEGPVQGAATSGGISEEGMNASAAEAQGALDLENSIGFRFSDDVGAEIDGFWEGEWGSGVSGEELFAAGEISALKIEES